MEPESELKKNTHTRTYGSVVLCFFQQKKWIMMQTREKIVRTKTQTAFKRYEKQRGLVHRCRAELFSVETPRLLQRCEVLELTRLVALGKYMGSFSKILFNMVRSPSPRFRSPTASANLLSTIAGEKTRVKKGGIDQRTLVC